MKPRFISGVSLILTLTVAMCLPAQTISDSQFLDLIESDLNFSPTFKADMLFEVFSSGGKSTTTEFVLYENSGKSIAQFQTPARDKGKAILQMDNKYWIYFPKTKRAMVLAPVASMVGHASNADVLRPPLSSLYSIKILNTPPKMGDRTVEYTAISREAPYGRIVTWYEGDKQLGSEVFARSGVLLKKIFNEEHIRNTSGRGWFPSKTRIVDSNNENNYTIITFSNVMVLKTINESWFNPNNLGRVR